MKPIFSACPHDIILDPEKWVAFVDYMQKKIGLGFDFKRFEGFDLFAKNFNQFSFVYAHPLHAAQLSKEKGYLPIAKYSETFDEAVVIAQKGAAAFDIKKIAGKNVACIPGTPSHAALLIELHNNNLDFDFEPVLMDTYPKVLMSVSVGEAEYGVILKSVWDDMLSMKERVRVVYTTSSRSLVHVFMVAPQLKDKLEVLKKALVSMSSDNEGKEILKRLKCQSISPFDDEDLKKLQKQLQVCRYEEAA